LDIAKPATKAPAFAPSKYQVPNWRILSVVIMSELALISLGTIASTNGSEVIHLMHQASNETHVNDSIREDSVQAAKL
jgi:hypothetical protein